MISFVTSLFTALANIKAIAGYIDAFAGAVTAWWIQRQKAETLRMIADATALTALAQSDEDRYAAATAWTKAISRPRVS